MSRSVKLVSLCGARISRRQDTCLFGHIVRVVVDNGQPNILAMRDSFGEGEKLVSAFQETFSEWYGISSTTKRKHTEQRDVSFSFISGDAEVGKDWSVLQAVKCNMICLDTE